MTSEPKLTQPTGSRVTGAIRRMRPVASVSRSAATTQRAITPNGPGTTAPPPASAANARSHSPPTAAASHGEGGKGGEPEPAAGGGRPRGGGVLARPGARPRGAADRVERLHRRAPRAAEPPQHDDQPRREPEELLVPEHLADGLVEQGHDLRR